MTITLPCAQSTISGSLSNAVFSISAWSLSRQRKNAAKPVLAVAAAGLCRRCRANSQWARARILLVGESNNSDIGSQNVSKIEGLRDDRCSNSCKAVYTSVEN